MSDLTPKREKFAQCVADGMSQADAYRASFNVAPTTKPESVHSRGSQLMANAQVASRVRELKNALEQKAIWTREDSARALVEIIRKQDLDAKTSDRVAALKVMHTLQGWDKQVVDHLSSDGSMSPSRVDESLVSALVDKLVD